jgi:hypothetical protein
MRATACSLRSQETKERLKVGALLAGIADIRACVSNVRFTPKSGHSQRRNVRLLSANSGRFDFPSQEPNTKLQL